MRIGALRYIEIIIITKGVSPAAKDNILNCDPVSVVVSELITPIDSSNDARKEAMVKADKRPIAIKIKRLNIDLICCNEP